VDVEAHLKRWLAAGVLDEPSAGRIRAFEALGSRPPQTFRWPIVVALALGAILLGAGVLLFVSAHWDQLSPAQRMSLVVLMVAAFHAGGAATAARFESLSITLHTVGTLALGAGIALTGQIFHLSEHWPGAVLLWGAGALAAWGILRHWTQGALSALLVPIWIGSEWEYRVAAMHLNYAAPIVAFACALAFTYLTAPATNTLNKALIWFGGIAVLPAAAVLAVANWYNPPSWQEQSVAWTLAYLLPVLLAFLLRGRQATWNLCATAWVCGLSLLNMAHQPGYILIYLWCGIGSVGLIAWGVREQRSERINLGMAGFALTVLVFYFSDVMDKLDRSLSLILLGFLFLGGGWIFERTRRRLVGSIQTATP
jgi:uncharacterized membrane protein